MEKKRLGIERYRNQELQVNCYAGFAAGSVAAAATNSFEAITVAKQTNPETKIFKMIKDDGAKLFTRGLASRVAYNGGQSFVLFNLLLQLGKVFDCELSD
jgi:hypothetical protein